MYVEEHHILGFGNFVFDFVQRGTFTNTIYVNKYWQLDDVKAGMKSYASGVMEHPEDNNSPFFQCVGWY